MTVPTYRLELHFLTHFPFKKVVDNGNVLQRIFPRVSATAEKLWSPYDVKDVVNAARRLEEHACRMKLRGLPAQPPNGPGFCLNK